MSENIMYKNIADKMKKANEEIEELKADNQELQDAVVWWNNRYNALQRDYEDYKSRCEKAVEYINNNPLYSEDYDYDEEDNLVWQGARCDEESEDLLNILNGRSDK